MGLEIELGFLLMLQLCASAVFSRFEGETPIWKKMLKWLVLDGTTISLYFAAGHAALLLPLCIAVLAVTLHVHGCRKQGIHPIYATPRKKYYAWRGWRWEE